MKAVKPFVVETRDQQRDGWDDPVKGRIGWRTLFSGDATPTDALTAGLAEVEPGGWLGLHRHTPAEVYYVIEGAGIVTIEAWSTRSRLAPRVFIPGDAEHGVRNPGTAPLRFVYVFPSDSFGEIEYRFSNDARSGSRRHLHFFLAADASDHLRQIRPRADLYAVVTAERGDELSVAAKSRRQSRS